MTPTAHPELACAAPSSRWGEEAGALLLAQAVAVAADVDDVAVVDPTSGKLDLQRHMAEKPMLEPQGVAELGVGRRPERRRHTTRTMGG